MALSFVQDKTPVDLLKMPLESMRQNLRARFDSIEMDNSAVTSQMKVFLRVRPFKKQEIEKEEDQKCFKIENFHTILAKAPPESFTFKNSIHGMGKVNHKYSFTKILSADCRQTDVFNTVVSDPLKEFIDGRNSLVFTYGITSSGKTYTIQGRSNAIGILPRALDVIFNSVGDHLRNNSSDHVIAPENFADVVKINSKDYDAICKQKEELIGCVSSEEQVLKSGGGATSETESVLSQDSLESAQSARLAQILSEANDRETDSGRLKCDFKEDIRFSIWVSFAEIYNENIYDLLVPVDFNKRPNATSNTASQRNGAATSRGLRRPTLELRTDKRGSIYIRGLRCFPVTSANDAYRILLIGRQNQQMASTRLNLTSSRSHTIFSIYAIRGTGKAHSNYARISTLSFCDLAGSERTVKTQNVGERLREAGNINTSLLTLGRCIQILRNNQENPDRPQLVPYRESKLTRLFQSFFTGKGKLCMLVNISQCASMFDETMHVLKFSALAKQIVVQQELQQPVLLDAQNDGKRTVEDEARRTRFRSLGLRTPKPGKPVSIFQTPVRCGKAPCSSLTSTLLFTGGDGTLREEPLEETLTSITEETRIEYDTEELLSIIEDLKTQLIQTKENAASVESRVRSEVCQEMDELVLQLESQHEEALREQEIFLQEQSERRIQLYLNSVNQTKTSNKRVRISPGDDDAKEDNQNQQTKLLVENLALRSKIEELEDELSDLRTQCSDQKEALTHVSREREELSLAVTRLQFHTSVAERDAAEKLARSEDAVRELGEQLEKLMAAPKDTSNISDIDCQLDQSRLKPVARDEKIEERDIVSSKQLTCVVVPTQKSRKKVFSPVLPKRPSDEIPNSVVEDSAPVMKSTVFSPILDRLSNSSDSVASDKRHYEDSTVSFTIPPTPATIVKKEPISLAKQNENLLAELKKMQTQLNSALQARQLAEESIGDLKQELANATSHLGSFVRHEMEIEHEEAMEKARKDVEVLRNEINNKETLIRELEKRCVSKHDALLEEHRLRKELATECDHLKKECQRRIDEVKEERQRRLELQHAGSDAEKLRSKCDALSKDLRHALSATESKKSDIVNLERKLNDAYAKIETSKKKADEADACLSRERSELQQELERFSQSAKKDISALKGKLASAERKVEDAKKSRSIIDALTCERDSLKANLNSLERKCEEIDKLKKTQELLVSERDGLKASVSGLKKQLSSEQNNRQQIEKYASQVAQMEKEIQKRTVHCRSLEANMEKINEELRTAKEEVRDLEKKLQEVTERYRCQKKTVESQNAYIKDLKEDLFKLDATIQKREQEFFELKERCQQMEKEMVSSRVSHISESKENRQPSCSSELSEKMQDASRDRSISRERKKTKSSYTETVPSTRRVTRSMRHK